MILNKLTHQSLKDAAAEIDLYGIPPNHIWNQYYLVVEGKEYPFKYIISKAMEQITGSAFTFNTNEGYRDELVRLGYQINEYVGGYNFFTKEELHFFAEIAGTPYRVDQSEHRHYRQKLQSIIRKMEYWANQVEELLPEPFKLKPDRHWNVSGTVKSYFWPRFYYKEDKDIFFNIEINGKGKFIGYKLDGYFETTRKLPKEKLEIVEQFKKDNNTGFIQIPFAKIHEYNWEQLISQTVDYILSLKDKFVELKDTLSIERRASRIIWNSNGWTGPSGPIGKSRTTGFESENSFGFDEWLFDESKQINGYVYGFLASLHMDYEANRGKVFDIVLFTRNGDAKQFYWVGLLRNVSVLNDDQIQDVLSIYEQNGWLSQMETELIDLQLNSNIINEWKAIGHNILNVRYPVSELQNLFTDLVPIEKDEIITTSRYKLLSSIDHINEGFKAAVNQKFDFETGSIEAELAISGKRIRKASSIELNYLHNELQRKFLKFLQSQFGKENVRRECLTAGSCRIDISRKSDDGFIFYELKVYNSPRQSIREAIGQLLDYCYFPNVQQAQELVLVTNKAPDMETQQYIETLKQMLKINFGYIHFCLEKGQIEGIY
ncbi:MAG: hypothetical protein ACN6O7_00510 [Sphingobacterium sp.]